MRVTKPRLNEVTRSVCMTDDQSNDQEMIAAWVSDLRKLAKSLGVCSTTPA